MQRSVQMRPASSLVCQPPALLTTHHLLATCPAQQAAPAPMPEMLGRKLLGTLTVNVNQGDSERGAEGVVYSRALLASARRP